MSKVLITGGTGLIGQRLTEFLLKNGHEVCYLSRRENLSTNIKMYLWNVEKGEIDFRAFNGVDHIIHLAGNGIADKRWTKERKKEIIDSRVKSTQLISEVIKKTTHKPSSFIGGSAIGFYGAIDSEHIFSEEDPCADDFLGKVCKDWEDSYDPIEEMGLRVVKIRTGIVLSNTGGALLKMLPVIKMGMGSVLGNGRQYVPWIHIDDICGIFMKAVESENMIGIYNAVAPGNTNNYQLTKTIAKVLNKPCFMPPVPSFALKLAFGEMAVIFLKGPQVSCTKLLRSGYVFKYPELTDALINLLVKTQINL